MEEKVEKNESLLNEAKQPQPEIFNLEIMSKIEEMNSRLTLQLTVMSEIFTSQAKDMNKMFTNQMEEMNKTFTSQMKEMNSHFKDQMEEMVVWFHKVKEDEKSNLAMTKMEKHGEQGLQSKLLKEENSQEEVGLKELEKNMDENMESKLEKENSKLASAYFDQISTSTVKIQDGSLIDSSSANQLLIQPREISEFPIDLTIPDNPTKFSFHPLNTVYLKNFSYENKTVELTKEVKNMVQFVSDKPIPEVGKQIIGVKIINAPEKSLYIGLIKQQRIRSDYSAKTPDSSTISYKIIGGKQLFVLNKNLQAHPLIEQDWLFIVVNYQGETIDWYINNTLVTSTRVNLKGSNEQKWHAFVTMKHTGNKVELMQ